MECTKISRENDNYSSKIPSSSVSCVRNTAALFCITRCIFNRIFEVGIEPFEFLILSSHAMVFWPASFSNGFCLSPAQQWVEVSLISHINIITDYLPLPYINLPGLWISATLFAQARPKTTMSRREFAPSRLAP